MAALDWSACPDVGSIPGKASGTLVSEAAVARASLVLITPCSRPELLCRVYESIRFSLVTRWIVVFDAEHVPHRTLPAELTRHPQITLAAMRVQSSKYGNAQRNLGLQIARTMYDHFDPLVYFLDDDTIVHPRFYDLLHSCMSRRDLFYTFNQRHEWLTCYGRSCLRGMMDTGMICLPLSFCPEWAPSAAYAEDYYFIQAVMKRYPHRHVYLNHVAAYYNALQPGVFNRLFGSQHQRHHGLACMVVLAMILAVLMQII